MVPILSSAEVEIFARYMGLGRDHSGRALVAEQEAMLGRLRRLGYEFDDADVLECWDAIADEEVKYRSEKKDPPS